MATIIELTESDVRQLRDLAYGKPSTDKNWDGCKEHWMTSENIAWLMEQKPHNNL